MFTVNCQVKKKHWALRKKQSEKVIRFLASTFLNMVNVQKKTILAPPGMAYMTLELLKDMSGRVGAIFTYMVVVWVCILACLPTKIRLSEKAFFFPLSSI